MNLREAVARLESLVSLAAQAGIDADGLKVFLTSDDGARVDEVHSIDLELDDNPWPGIYLSTEGGLQ